MEVSKAFDFIPHELLIAKMHAYGFDLNSVTFIHSCLKNRKQNVKINNTCTDDDTITSSSGRLP